MKMLTCLLTLVMSFSTLASSGETKTFVYDGSQDSVELLLRGEKTHTEYRIEQRRSICYRTEVVGYRTVCRGGGRSGPGRRPGPQNCHREPIYRQVSYPCIQTVSVPYEVKDYDVDARVNLDVAKLGDVASVESFRVTLMGDTLTLEGVGSKKFFHMLKRQDVRPTMSGSVKYIDAVYSIELVESAPVLAALKVNGLSYENGVLSFGLGSISSTQNIGFSLSVIKRPILGANTVLFDRELAHSEIDIVAAGNNAIGNVNLGRLGVSLVGGRFGLTPKVFFKHEGTLLNKNQFAELEASRTLLLKL